MSSRARPELEPVLVVPLGLFGVCLLLPMPVAYELSRQDPILGTGLAVAILAVAGACIAPTIVWLLQGGLSESERRRWSKRRVDPPPAVEEPRRPRPLEERMGVLQRRWPRNELGECWTGDAVEFDLARATWSLRGWLAGGNRLPVRISPHALAVGRRTFTAHEIRQARVDGQRIVVHRVGERAWRSPRVLFADRKRVAEMLAELDHEDGEILEHARASSALRAALEPFRHLHK